MGPLAALAIGAGTKLFGSLIGAGVGGRQQREGRRMMRLADRLRRDYVRPEFEIPDAYRRMVNMAQGQMFQRLPGAVNYENLIRGATASGASALRQMGAGAEAMGGISDLYARQMGALQNLAMQEAGFRQEGQDRYMRALEGLGGWEHQAFEWDKIMPYMTAMERAAQLEGAGRENVMEGFRTRAGVWSETARGLGDMFSNPEIIRLISER